ncbi:c-type cytochrome [Alkalilimnicola ehrlichii MLHE-1]|uniref:Cytochrome c, class I n=1 Tax=Alkalilimnicola ehrlichii (strain ATCC BAA-1101 / DSM 17681 / MLHE-1) TaxID=187272 RepID=Q0ABB0_ALKEH|nr:cytochrome c [Alkalilimnicola ehrlichii]ABI55877.1 cytochrome c, class I [Alkalilimnicola ehrlichii MLHE-1]
MPTIRTMAAGVALAAAMLAGPVQAGDPVAGALKADTCMGCHGVPGQRNVYPSYHVPKLGGQHAQYLVDALRAFREGLRDHPTMNAQARSLSEGDIEDIAAFFAASEPGSRGR